MVFGSLFKRGLTFLTDTIGRMNKHLPGIVQHGTKFLGALGYKGAFPSIIGTGLKHLDTADKYLQQFSSKTPMEQAGQVVGHGVDLAQRMTPMLGRLLAGEPQR